MPKATLDLQSFNKRIGQTLIDCALISEAKLNVALFEQQLFQQLRIGEILVAHGWTKEETVVFFAEQWSVIPHTPIRYPLGQYLHAAGLLSSQHIMAILQQQRRTGYKFGAIAVLLELIQPETLDYFIQNLFPEHQAETPILPLYKPTLIQSLTDIRFNDSVLEEIDLKKGLN